MRLRLSLLLMVLALVAGMASAQTRLDLNGSWQFREAGGKDWLPATVPGDVFQDLLAAKLIPDPYVGNHAAEVQWVEQLDWEYHKQFEVTQPLLNEGEVDLVLEGIDTYADIEVNGQRLGTVNNMHRGYRFACKPYLRLGQNTVTIHFKSAVQTAMAAYKASPFKLPSGNDAAEAKVSPYVRKAAYHFGWDFAPRLVGVGLWRPIYLEGWTGVRVAHVQAVPTRMDAHEVPVRLGVELEVAEAGEYDIEARIDDALVVSSTRDLQRGNRMVTLQFTIHEPEFWWPRGMGEQRLYALKVRVGKGSASLDSHVQDLGLRSIKLVMEPDSMGTSFYFLVNDFLPGRGGPYYAKGANYVPEDMSLARGRARSWANLEAAHAVGMNMVRVWGGGTWADDSFYEWCDRHGMLVWQDFPFACMMYPLEGPFLENVKGEVEENVRRLRAHPSLAIWCGNNEIDVAWHNWGWQQESGFSEAFGNKLWAQYQAFFQQWVPNQLNAMDPGRAYIPTSPLRNWGKMENFDHLNMHYWGVWHGTDSLDGFQKYVPRFMTEYGFQSWPSPASLQPYIQPQDWTRQSPAIVARQKSYKGNVPILRFMEPAYGSPQSLEGFLKLSQYVQRDAMTMAIKAHRMAQPHCMGTLYWQLNDCWPGPSWSTIAHDGRWKAAHYALRRLYGPVLVSTSVIHDSLMIDIASDELPTLCNLNIRLKTLDGEVRSGYEATFTVLPGSRRYLTLPMTSLSGHIDPAHEFIEVSLFHGREELDCDLYYFAPPKQLDLSDPHYSYQVTPTDTGYILSMMSRTLVKDVEILADDPSIVIRDNYFDLVPGKPRYVVIDADPKLGPLGITRLLHFSDLSRVMRN